MEGKINFSQLCSNTSKVKEAVKSETMEGVRGMSGKVNKYIYQICVRKHAQRSSEFGDWQNNRICTSKVGNYVNEKEGDLKLNIDFGSPCDLEKRVFVSNTLDSKRCWWIDSLNFPHLYFVHQRRG